MLVFLWAYSQAALVALVVPSAGSPSWVYQYIAWLLFYVTLAFGLWALLGRLHRLPRGMAWRRALAGWAAAELLLGIFSAGALYSGIIQME